MKYEQLQNQSVDAQNAIKFLPKSLLEVVTKTPEGSGLLRKNQIVELKDHRIDIDDSKILPREIDYNYGQLEIQPSSILDREKEEKRNVMVATGIGTVALVLLTYFLFF